MLTFQGGASGALEEIPSAVFDDQIAELKLDLIVDTRIQFWKGTTVQNGNRMCVIETPENLRTIPESMPVTNPTTKRTHQVRITFRGQERYCSRCNVMHAKCPEAEKRQEKREERERLKGDTKTKLYSDSTLRSADVLGLTADILCMSGGGIGQVIQAVIDDPDDCEQVAIFGGANDKKVENFPDTEEYAHNIDLAVTKLGQFARENEHKHFYLFNFI